MSRRQVQSEQAPAPGGGYSQAIVANGFLYTAGMGAIDAETGETIGDTIDEQTAKVMTNLLAVLRAADLDFSDVVKATVHLQDVRRDFAGFDATYRKYMSPPLPVRTTVGSELTGILVEIDMVAALRQ